MDEKLYAIVLNLLGHYQSDGYGINAPTTPTYIQKAVIGLARSLLMQIQNKFVGQSQMDLRVDIRILSQEVDPYIDDFVFQIKTLGLLAEEIGKELRGGQNNGHIPIHYYQHTIRVFYSYPQDKEEPTNRFELLDFEK